MNTDKAPMIVTLALVIIGWAVTHVVDRVISAPTIEDYTVTKIVDKHPVLYIRLTNLADATTFRNLSLKIFPPSGTTIGRLRVIPVAPASAGDERSVNDGRLSAWAQIAEIQPGNVFYGRVPYTGDQPPLVQISLVNATARIVEPSLETWFVKHEIESTACWSQVGYP